MTQQAVPQNNIRFESSARSAADYQLQCMFEWAKDGSAIPFPLTMATHATVELLIAATIEAMEWEEKSACPGCGCTEADACADVQGLGWPCSWTVVENDRGFRYCSACVVDDERPE